MEKKKGLRFWTRSVFNVSRWLGWEDLRKNASNIHGMYQSLFKAKNVSGFKETFDQAIFRMGLSEEDLKNAMLSYWYKSLFFLVMLLSGLVYHLHLIINGYIFASIIMVSVNFMLFAFWFKEHFWYTQIRVRRLGLTFVEWLKLCFYFGG